MNLNSQLPIKKSQNDDQKYRITQQKQFQQITPFKQEYYQSKQIKIDPSKHSNKKNGIIQSYGANTHQGNVRTYNEDRVSIILNMIRPENKKNEIYWPICSFFAIYDGHGGAKCADYLRDQLHQLIIRDEYFPKDPKKSISRCIYKIEQQFIEMSVQYKQTILDKSGSCIIMVLIVDKICYIANVGDSRALLYNQKEKTLKNLSQDHKPNLSVEKKRIIENGGQIYQSYIKSATTSGMAPQIIYGPYRVFPGRLSVSRTIGDIEAKLQKFGGNSKCVVCQPDIIEIEINENHDFIVLGCKIQQILGDGIFDKMKNKDVLKSILKTEVKSKDFHQYTGDCVNNLMNQVLISQSMDNITIVMICFQNFSNQFQELAQKNLQQQAIQNLQQNKIEEELFENQDNQITINQLNQEIEQQCFSKFNSSEQQQQTVQNFQKNNENNNLFKNTLYQ